jgi:hypothetical protein
MNWRDVRLVGWEVLELGTRVTGSGRVSGYGLGMQEFLGCHEKFLELYDVV